MIRINFVCCFNFYNTQFKRFHPLMILFFIFLILNTESEMIEPGIKIHKTANSWNHRHGPTSFTRQLSHDSLGTYRYPRAHPTLFYSYKVGSVVLLQVYGFTCVDILCLFQVHFRDISKSLCYLLYQVCLNHKNKSYNHSRRIFIADKTYHLITLSPSIR